MSNRIDSTETSATWAAVGSDGMRSVVWGLGATPEAALADAAEQEGAPRDLATHPITAAAVAAVEDGDVGIDHRGGLTMRGQTVDARCECGGWSGHRCEAALGDTPVTVEYMPDEHRAGHRSAGHSGRYPANGSRRITVTAQCAEMMLEQEPEWTSVVETGGAS